MSSVEKLSECSSYPVDRIAQECGIRVADVQEWCRDGLGLVDGRISLYDLLRFIDDKHIKVDETSPLLAEGRREFEERKGYVVGRIFPHYGRVA